MGDLNWRFYDPRRRRWLERRWLACPKCGAISHHPAVPGMLVCPRCDRESWDRPRGLWVAIAVGRDWDDAGAAEWWARDWCRVIYRGNGWAGVTWPRWYGPTWLLRGDIRAPMGAMRWAGPHPFGG
jgi:hypothetical protein